MALIGDLRTPKILATDVAFRLPFERPVVDRGKIHVGLNVSGLLFNGGYNRRNMFGLRADYPALVGSLMRYFTAISNCRVHLIGHVNSDTHAVEDDRRVALALTEEYPGTVLAPQFRSPSEAKGYISGMDFFCGSRMHACIAALSSGVPVLPIAYSRKFRGLFGTLGYHHYADCQSDKTEDIVSKVIEAFENRTALLSAVAAANEKAVERLGEYEDALRVSIISLAGRIA
jgi:polysaccharide pyruvyl transferase WcaK-like protein